MMTALERRIWNSRLLAMNPSVSPIGYCSTRGIYCATPKEFEASAKLGQEGICATPEGFIRVIKKECNE